MLRRTAPAAFALLKTPPIVNERMDSFAPGSPEAKSTLAACKAVRGTTAECPIIIGGKKFTAEKEMLHRMPTDHQTVIAKSYSATPELGAKAVEAAMAAAEEWRHTPFRERAAVFLKAAHLLTTKHRDAMRAATMMGQGKNPWQAEIDCVAEAADFLRWNVHFAEQMYQQQPLSVGGSGIWNMTDYRPLEGFWSAITPFNFTAIAANLASAPALMGNVVVWKPSSTALLSNYLMMEIFQEAGLPDGVINFLPCNSSTIQAVNADPRLSGVVFTGSTKTFVDINKRVYSQLEQYNEYPRMSGETGGKDFHIVHPSADLRAAAAATVRAAFEFQGQKCSACSRCYVAKSVAKEFKELVLRGQQQIKMGQPDDFANFMCAVIDETSFDKNKRYIDLAKSESATHTVLAGGECDKTRGYFVQPTVIATTDPKSPLMVEEIFGPVVAIYEYDDSKPESWKDVCTLASTSTKYALTGAIFARDRAPIQEANRYLRHACGNYYVNDKCTGAVVGQQPFGGGRQSGSNDKPGGPLFLTRFVSARSIKENFDVTPAISYPHQLPDVYTI